MHLIMFCSQTKGRAKKTIFIPYEAGLDIPILDPNSPEYLHYKLKLEQLYFTQDQ